MQKMFSQLTTEHANFLTELVTGKTALKCDIMREGLYSKYDRVESANELQAGDYIALDILSFSDYHNGSVQAANVEFFKRDYADNESILIENWSYGGESVYIGIDFLTANTEESNELIELLQKLCDYPLCDEDLHSELELKWQYESFTNGYIKEDFISALVKKFPEREEELNQKEDSEVYSLLLAAMESENVYFENQNGTDYWVDIESLVESMDSAPNLAS
jgi:hypothetical protein